MILGMAGILDSARLNFSYQNFWISLFVILTQWLLGGHGDTMVPLDYTTISEFWTNTLN